MIEFLDKKHRRENFDGGKALLNNYLKTQAGQDINQKLSTCFVLADPQTNDIQGYYTLSNNSIPISSFPEHIQKKLPKSLHIFGLLALARGRTHKDNKRLSDELTASYFRNNT